MKKFLGVFVLTVREQRVVLALVFLLVVATMITRCHARQLSIVHARDVRVADELRR